MRVLPGSPYVLIFLVWLALPRAAAACASCGCGDPTLTAMGQEKPFKNRVRLALEQRLGAHSTGAPAEQSLVSRTAVSASWSPLSWLTLGTLAPLIAVRSEAAQLPARQTVGFGDVELLVRALVFRDRRFSPRHIIGLLAGLKTPTGPRVSDSTGYPAPDDGQPGSGSWDGVYGASYGYFGARGSAFLSASYRQTTAGYRGYQRGAVLGASLAFQFAVNRWSALVLGADFTHTEPSRLDSATRAPDTGGELLAASPGLLFALHQDVLLRFALQVPVIQSWRGRQSETATGVVSLVVDL